MAKVLSAIAPFGLEAVLVAVDLVLESGLPSAEHIENMLNRLKSGPLPPPVETVLTVSEGPMAPFCLIHFLKRDLPPTAKPYREDFHQYVPGMMRPAAAE